MTLEVDVRHRQGDFVLEAAFSAEPGVTALFGRSGAGKSTLAGLVAGHRRPTSGRIALDGSVLVDSATGTCLPPRKRRIGVVFQEGRLFPHMSVKQNLLYGRRFAKPAEENEDPQRIIDLLGIGGLLDRRPRNLSGGEQQRVAIGRALLMSPRALIMDEPLAAIDQARRAEILPYLDRLRSEMRIPILYVSHAVDEIARLADTVVVLDEGRLLAVGPTAEILSRLDLAPLAEAEHSAILAGTVQEVDTARGVATVLHAAGPLTVPGLAAPPETIVRLRIHSRDVAIAVGPLGRMSIRNRLPAMVVSISPRDRAIVDVTLDLSGSTLLASLTADAVAELQLQPGSEVTALIKAVAVEGY